MVLCLLEQLELRWQEYYELVTVLLQWIQHHINIFGERKFPGSYEEIEVSSQHRFGMLQTLLFVSGLKELFTAVSAVSV